MIVTGYKFQHALRELGHRRDNAAKQFANSLFAFEEEEGALNPLECMSTFRTCEHKIARLQTAQQEYNLAVLVTIYMGGENTSCVTLCEVVKMVGGAGRAEKMWRTCASATGRERYEGRELFRDATQVRAKRQIPVDAAMEQAHEAAKIASAIRTAIAIGNSNEMEVELDPSLFE